jgi:preprotein translocase subunit YajC
VLVSSGSAAVVLAASKNSGSSGFSYLFLVILIAGAYLLFIRPQKARQRRALETRRSVEPGVEVVTTAGLIATVISSDDETVTLEIAPGVQSKFLKQAIARVVTPPEPHEEIGPDTSGQTPPTP